MMDDAGIKVFRQLGKTEMVTAMAKQLAEPLTEAWLRVAIGPPIPGQGFQLTEDLSIFSSRCGWCLFFTGGEGDANAKLLKSIPTRGHFLALCKALSVPLSDSP